MHTSCQEFCWVLDEKVAQAKKVVCTQDWGFCRSAFNEEQPNSMWSSSLLLLESQRLHNLCPLHSCSPIATRLHCKLMRASPQLCQMFALTPRDYSLQPGSWSVACRVYLGLLYCCRIIAKCWTPLQAFTDSRY